MISVIISRLDFGTLAGLRGYLQGLAREGGGEPPILTDKSRTDTIAVSSYVLISAHTAGTSYVRY